MKINQGVVAGKNFDDVIEKLKVQNFLWYQPSVTRLSNNTQNKLFVSQTVNNCLKDIYIDSHGNLLLDKKLEAYNKDKENSSLSFYAFEAKFNE